MLGKKDKLSLGDHVSNGNKKIGNDTLIFNFTPAMNCPSKPKGFCQVPGNKCYALKAEKAWRGPLPYRRRQAELWKKTTAWDFANQLKGILKRKRKTVKYFRFSEAGDFTCQADVEKLKEIAKMVPELTFYGYTARRDLAYQNLPDNLIVNGSGFMVDNEFVASENPAGNLCPGNCRVCNKCKVKGKQTIHVQIH